MSKRLQDFYKLKKGENLMDYLNLFDIKNQNIAFIDLIKKETKFKIIFHHLKAIN